MLALPNYSSLGSIVTEDDDYNSARSALKEAGWSYLGGGAECACYGSPCGSRVAKVTYGTDTGQYATLDAALRHPDNPHLPTVYGFLELTGDGSLVFETERLEPSSGEDRNRFYKSGGAIYSGGDDATEDDLEEIEALPDGPAKEALRALCEIALERGLSWDAHEANVMVRPSDGKLVLNDALYNGA